MRKITRTIYMGELQTARFFRTPYTARNNSTLNQKFNIHPTETFVPGNYPATRYFAIGRGGHRVEAGPDGTTFISPIPHRVRDAALYTHTPFVLRPENNDIPAEERTKYALRRSEVHNGNRYFAYYLKRIDMTNTTSSLHQVRVRDGVSQTAPFSPVAGDLNPTPPQVNPMGQVPSLSDGDYLTASAVITIQLTPTEIQELINVARVLHNDDRYAIISEVAIVSAEDRVVTASGMGGNQFNFTEAIGAQVMIFYSTYRQLINDNDGATFTINVGSTESLLTEIGSDESVILP